MTWQIAAQTYLTRLGAAEYAAAMQSHRKAGRSPRTYRHSPSQYHRDLVAHLGRNDENAFKTCKMLQGYTSAVRS